MTLLFYYLVLLQNDAVVTSQCVQFTFGDKGEVYQLDERALPVMKKESMWEGKKTISPRMIYGHANYAQTHSFVWAQNELRFACPKKFDTNLS